MSGPIFNQPHTIDDRVDHSRPDATLARTRPEIIPECVRFVCVAAMSMCGIYLYDVVAATYTTGSMIENAHTHTHGYSFVIRSISVSVNSPVQLYQLLVWLQHMCVRVCLCVCL